MPKFDKLKQRINLAIKEKNTYEALQIYRTIRNRCHDQEQALECLDLLFDGIQHFAKEKEETAMIDLAEVYADTLVAFEVPPSERIYSQIDTINGLYPECLHAAAVLTPTNANLQSKFTNGIVKWSNVFPSQPFHVTPLKQIFGNAFTKDSADMVDDMGLD